MKTWPFSKIRALGQQIATNNSALALVGRQRDEARETAQSLSLELEEAQRELHAERTLRISAEAIASERLSQVERAYESAARAEQARDEAVKGRLSSLDLVNSQFLKLFVPEQAPTNIKEFSKGLEQLPHRRNRLSGRAGDIEFVKQKIAEFAKKREAASEQIAPTESAVTQ